MRGALVLLLTGLALGAPTVAAQQPQVGTQGAEASEATLVVLVRHAERAEDDPRDPNLSTEGHERAEALAVLLRDAGFTHLWTTDYRRTRQTAAPMAEAGGLTPAVYDPSGPGLAAFAQRLRTTPGRHLVVGHSNTTPDLVRALGGEPHGTIEESEYDRLYVLVIAPGGAVTTTLLRFGEAFETVGSPPPVRPGG